MTDMLPDIIQRNRAGECIAIPSVCSSQPDVLRASLAMAERLNRQIAIEATSNQDGGFGYTGITPSGFISYVNGLAGEAGADRARITFGGDHLGPQAWRHMGAETCTIKSARPGTRLRRRWLWQNSSRLFRRMRWKTCATGR